MALPDSVVRTKPDGSGSSLLCGKPGCGQLAQTCASFTWQDTGWTGVIGACWEHHEDLGVVILGHRHQGEFLPESGDAS